MAELDHLVSQLRERLQRPVLIALDGRSGVGKTTLAVEIARRYGGALITADDFWSGGRDDQWARLPPGERAAQAIDWRRLRAEALVPLLAGHTAVWRTFDWNTGAGLSPGEVTHEPMPVIVLDGAYSARPEFADIVDIAVLLKLDDQTRRARLRAREGEASMRQWHAIWDSAEDHYFTLVRPEESFDMVVAVE